MPPLLATAALVAVLAASVALAACGSTTSGSGRTPDGRLEVVAGFYPLEFVAEQVGGDAVTVRNLTAPGAEPHDLELSPREIGGLGEAGLVVYLRGFQPAVDEAVAAEAGPAALDVSGAARLDPPSDPHFWLDPTRLADVADAVGERLAALRPDKAEEVRRRADALRGRLAGLDRDMRGALSGCRVRTLVTSHEAFGYLARRYGLEEVGVAGRSPDQEPSAGDVARLVDLVRDRGVTTVYSESLASPRLARTVAEEAGARTAALDPLEGLAESSDGDYLSVMRDNLATLRAGQSCP